MVNPDERTLPLTEVVFRFVAGNFRLLGIVGAVTLVAAVVAIKVTQPPPPPPAEPPRQVCRYVRQASAQQRMRDALAQKERQLEVYSTVYAAFRDGGERDPMAVDARKEAADAFKKIVELRKCIARFGSLPQVCENVLSNENEVLYRDAPAGVNIQLKHAYRLERTAVQPDASSAADDKGRRKRLVLAGWVAFNGVFAVLLAIWRRLRARSSRK